MTQVDCFEQEPVQGTVTMSPEKFMQVVLFMARTLQPEMFEKMMKESSRRPEFCQEFFQNRLQQMMQDVFLRSLYPLLYRQGQIDKHGNFIMGWRQNMAIIGVFFFIISQVCNTYFSGPDKKLIEINSSQQVEVSTKDTQKGIQAFQEYFNKNIGNQGFKGSYRVSNKGIIYRYTGLGCAIIDKASFGAIVGAIKYWTSEKTSGDFKFFIHKAETFDVIKKFSSTEKLFEYVVNEIEKEEQS